MSLFPIFLKLDGRPCLVVGAGVVAEGKVAGLIESGAVIHVVAPHATCAVEQHARRGEIRWSQREFEPADLDGVFMAVVATSCRELNERIFQEAQRRRILCNVVDDPAHCDFYYPSVVRRGDLQFAISTAGNSPALAQRLRGEIEEQYEAEHSAWVARLGRTRRGLFRRDMDAEQRRDLLHRLASRERFAVFLHRTRSRGSENMKAGVGYGW